MFIIITLKQSYNRCHHCLQDGQYLSTMQAPTIKQWVWKFNTAARVSPIWRSASWRIISIFLAVVVAISASLQVVTPWWPFTLIDTMCTIFSTCMTLIWSQVIPPDPGHIGWIAPLSICVLLFLGNGGYGTLIWVVMAELLPPRWIFIYLSLLPSFLAGCVPRQMP